MMKSEPKRKCCDVKLINNRQIMVPSESVRLVLQSFFMRSQIPAVLKISQFRVRGHEIRVQAGDSE